MNKSSQCITLGDGRKVGSGEPVFIIAEIGNNHQGNFDLAIEAIKQASECCADAVSFQYAPIETYCIKSLHDKPELSYLKECEFTLSQLSQLRECAKSLGLSFSINVEDSDTLDKVVEIGIDFIKLCSADLTNIPYIQHSCTRGLPIFFSTGAAYLEEIQIAFEAMTSAGLKDYVIYHTNSAYPTPISEANILQMNTLAKEIGGLIGYCDHTVEILPPVVAVSRGASVIEKHITTSRDLKGDDWMVSLEPGEFKQMVSLIRQTELALGTSEKLPLPSEEETRSFKRKSIVSKIKISKGSTINKEDLNFKAPGTGISPAELDKVIGKKAKVDIEEDILIDLNFLEES